jgi:diaminohydroxyphosphoribosylaminopyrimidine deaminase/5-amino-6-(5-phosphoribosylamino)uracil reductase
VQQQMGVEFIDVPTVSGGLDLRATLSALGTRGITRVLAEGGGELSAGLLREELVDRVYWFRAATVVGGDGVPAAQAFGVERLADARMFSRVDMETLGADVLETYRRA